MSDSDDEFDNLFSFSTATPTAKSGSAAVVPRTSSSPIDFDLSEEGRSVTRNSSVTDANVNVDSIIHGDVANDNDTDAPAISTSAHTSDTGSYYKVSPPTSAMMENDDDVDDNNAIFDLDAVKPSRMGLKDDDFHAMDSDTREFLDFLDKEPEKKTDIQLHQSTNGLSDDGEDGDDDDDGMMDFVDIDSDAHTRGDRGNVTVGMDMDEVTLTPKPSTSKSLNQEPTLLEDMDNIEKEQNRGKNVEGKKEEPIDKSDDKDMSMTYGNAPTIAAVPPLSPKPSPKSQPLPKKSPLRLMARVHPFSKPVGPVRMQSVPGKPKGASPMQRTLSSSGPTTLSTRVSHSTPSHYQNNSILMSTDGIDAEHSNLNANISDSHSLTMKSSEKDKKEGSVEGDDSMEETQMSNPEESSIPVPEEKEIVFSSFSEAIHSSESTMKHIRPLLYPKSNTMEITPVVDEERPWLWSKAICGNKVLDDVESSSLADSFTTWDDMFDMDALVAGTKTYELQEKFRNKLLEEVDLLAANLVASDGGTDDVALAKRDLCSLLIFYYRSTYISSNSHGLSKDSFEDGKEGEDIDDVDEDLQFEEEVTENLKMNPDENEGKEEGGTEEEKNADIKNNEDPCQNSDKTEDEPAAIKTKADDESEAKSDMKDTENAKHYGVLKGIQPEGQFVEWNAFIGPIAVTLLSSGMSTPVVSVMISRIVPTHMPLIPLMELERLHAVKTLHQKLYFLICYHLPLLVLHLDKNIPGWHWPKSLANNEDENESETNDDVTASPTKRSRNLESQGIVPITWFTSLLAGEDSSSPLSPNQLLALWDILLTNEDLSLKFFLALSVLERNSDSLLMLKGQELIDELSSVMSLERNDDVTMESFVGSDVASDSVSLTKSQKQILTWTNHAQSLRESTPLSVVELLRVAEDKAMSFALNLRSKLAMEKMKARLEAEAEAHRQAVEEENARRLEEKKHRYYKEKLEKFYRRHCPEKIDSIDKILEVYKDRYQVLDNKLIFKYGRGFLPLISVFNPQVTSKTNKIISNVGQGIENKKNRIILSRAEERAKMLEEEMELDGTQRKHQVAVKVDAKEILPVVCVNKNSHTPTITREPLKYYLVDSRPEETQKIQGAFPTAARLSPEDLMDPDRIQEKVEMFESLRGGAHIVIMGEGFSALPALYGHQLDKIEEKLLDSDESRTNMCALFFIKKGFPFVSVLDGGFAAAHAWLARDCDYLALNEVLINYDEDTSLFADLHKSYEEQKEFASASARRKTTIAMQRLIDNSLVRLTNAETQFEGFTDRVITARKEAKEKAMKEKEMKAKTDQEKKDNNKSSAPIEANGPKPFQNAFAGIRNKIPQKEKTDSASVEAPKAFDFGKISFGRKNNALSKNKKDEDDDLEREIDASLTPVKDDSSSKSKPPASPMRKIRFGGKNNATTDGNKKDSGPLAFKNALGMSFKKFNSMKPLTSKSKKNSALREEESIFFDEDD